MSGKPLWRHQDAARGIGWRRRPRGTPTVHDGRVYAMGATGIVNALDARTGARIWTRNAERDITSVGLDGRILWANHSEAGVGIVQPRVLGDGSVLAPSGEALRGLGVRRLAVSRAPDGSWKVEERWTSRGLKPYFNDFVVHKGHAYGFDGTILSAISLETGERVWKGGRYGAGQMLLLPLQDLLLECQARQDP